MPGLPIAADVIEAARARLSAWSDDRLAAALGDAEAELESGDVDAAFAALAGGLEGADGRSASTAAAALLALAASRRDDATTFWRAAAVVLDGERQARRGTQRRARDPLDRTIEALLQREPGACARRVRQYLRFLATARSAPLVDADDEGITYSTPTGALRDVTWSAVAVRVSRTRRRISLPVPESPRAHPAHNTDREARRDVPIPHDRV